MFPCYNWPKPCNIRLKRCIWGVQQNWKRSKDLWLNLETRLTTTIFMDRERDHGLWNWWWSALSPGIGASVSRAFTTDRVEDHGPLRSSRSLLGLRCRGSSLGTYWLIFTDAPTSRHEDHGVWRPSWSSFGGGRLRGWPGEATVCLPRASTQPVIKITDRGGAPGTWSLVTYKS